MLRTEARRIRYRSGSARRGPPARLRKDGHGLRYPCLGTGVHTRLEAEPLAAVRARQAKGAYRMSHPSRPCRGYLALAGTPNSPEPGTLFCFPRQLMLGCRWDAEGPVKVQGAAERRAAHAAADAESRPAAAGHAFRFRPIARGPQDRRRPCHRSHANLPALACTQSSAEPSLTLRHRQKQPKRHPGAATSSQEFPRTRSLPCGSISQHQTLPWS